MAHLDERLTNWQVLPVDAAVADRWGLLAARAKAQGVALPVIDGLLAATAIQHNLTVVSRNTSDFAGAHVAMLDPWEDEIRSPHSSAYSTIEWVGLAVAPPDKRLDSPQPVQRIP